MAAKAFIIRLFERKGKSSRILTASPYKETVNMHQFTVYL